jgi:hypothetical protein
MLTRCWHTVSMKTTTVRDIPDELYATIRRLAAQERRSINSQMVVMLMDQAAVLLQKDAD